MRAALASLPLTITTLTIALTLTIASAHAHRGSDSYLWLDLESGQATQGQTVRGRIDLALQDLARVIPINHDADHWITWEDVQLAQPALLAFVTQALALSGTVPCSLASRELKLTEHTDAPYIAVSFTARCNQAGPGDAITLTANPFFDVDTSHRVLVTVKTRHGTIVEVLSPSRQTLAFPVASLSASLESDPRSPLDGFLSFVERGVIHIWYGFDHLLFLATLLLPAVLVRQHHTWAPATSSRQIGWEVARIVTAFSVAHALTLSLCTLADVDVPSRWVEPAIALTVLLCALNNIWPVVIRERVSAAFGLGLIHGLGFAGAIAQMDLPSHQFLGALLGFNLGVEIGQLAVLAGLLPLVYLARHSTVYARLVMPGCSFVISLIAMAWLLERLLEHSDTLVVG